MGDRLPMVEERFQMQFNGLSGHRHGFFPRFALSETPRTRRHHDGIPADFLTHKYDSISCHLVT